MSPFACFDMILKANSGTLLSAIILSLLSNRVAAIRLWTENGKTGIVFTYSSEFNEAEVKTILSGAEEIGKHSCIPIHVFSPEEQHDLDPSFLASYVHIYKARDCFADIGYQTGKQYMRLNLRHCPGKGGVMHEMLHSLGYDHEQNRRDRDDYVTIQEQNVKSGFLRNFAKNPEALVAGPYDFRSIMHYGAYTYTVDANLPTIVSKIPYETVPDEQTLELSEGDKLKIRRATGCLI